VHTSHVVVRRSEQAGKGDEIEGLARIGMDR
jgi:hypothetical protein